MGDINDQEGMIKIMNWMCLFFNWLSFLLYNYSGWDSQWREIERWIGLWGNIDAIQVKLMVMVDRLFIIR